jgi:hypothetical protein
MTQEPTAEDAEKLVCDAAARVELLVANTGGALRNTLCAPFKVGRRFADESGSLRLQEGRRRI